MSISEFCKNLLDSLYEGVFTLDGEGRITYWSKGAEKITGYKSEEVLGTRCSDNVLVHVDERGASLCGTEDCPFVKAIIKGGAPHREIYLLHKEGHRVPVLVSAVSMKDGNGHIVGAVETFIDYSPKVAAYADIEELRKMALIDPLTELGNRRYLEVQLNGKLEEMHRYGWPFGVLFLDIDYFKKVNDAYGHDVGDKLLKMVARTLLSNLRLFDIVCRWGGEEFVAIIANVNQEQLCSIANKLRVLVEQSRLRVGTNVIQTTISIGATLARANDTVDTIIKRVDELMYQSKTSGRNRVTCNS